MGGRPSLFFEAGSREVFALGATSFPQIVWLSVESGALRLGAAPKNNSSIEGFCVTSYSFDRFFRGRCGVGGRPCARGRADPISNSMVKR